MKQKNTKSMEDIFQEIGSRVDSENRQPILAGCVMNALGVVALVVLYWLAWNLALSPLAGVEAISLLQATLQVALALVFLAVVSRLLR